MGQIFSVDNTVDAGKDENPYKNHSTPIEAFSDTSTSRLTERVEKLAPAVRKKRELGQFLLEQINLIANKCNSLNREITIGAHRLAVNVHIAKERLNISSDLIKSAYSILNLDDYIGATDNKKLELLFDCIDKVEEAFKTFEKSEEKEELIKTFYILYSEAIKILNLYSTTLQPENLLKFLEFKKKELRGRKLTPKDQHIYFQVINDEIRKSIFLCLPAEKVIIKTRSNEYQIDNLCLFMHIIEAQQKLLSIRSIINEDNQEPLKRSIRENVLSALEFAKNIKIENAEEFSFLYRDLALIVKESKEEKLLMKFKKMINTWCVQQEKKEKTFAFLVKARSLLALNQTRDLVKEFKDKWQKVFATKDLSVVELQNIFYVLSYLYSKNTALGNHLGQSLIEALGENLAYNLNKQGKEERNSTIFHTASLYYNSALQFKLPINMEKIQSLFESEKIPENMLEYVKAIDLLVDLKDVLNKELQESKLSYLSDGAVDYLLSSGFNVQEDFDVSLAMISLLFKQGRNSLAFYCCDELVQHLFLSEPKINFEEFSEKFQDIQAMLIDYTSIAEVKLWLETQEGDIRDFYTGTDQAQSILLESFGILFIHAKEEQERNNS